MRYVYRFLMLLAFWWRWAPPRTHRPALSPVCQPGKPCAQWISCSCADAVSTSPTALAAGVTADACTMPPTTNPKPCYFAYSSTTTGSQIQVTQSIANALVQTTDFWAVGEPAPKPFTYMPFGIGQRLCIGQHFAMMEIQVEAVAQTEST
jgi:Cytochrome P450